MSCSNVLPEEHPVGGVQDEEEQREADPGGFVDVESVYAGALGLGGLGRARWGRRRWRRLRQHPRGAVLQKETRRLRTLNKEKLLFDHTQIFFVCQVRIIFNKMYLVWSIWVLRWRRRRRRLGGGCVVVSQNNVHQAVFHQCHEHETIGEI